MWLPFVEALRTLLTSPDADLIALLAGRGSAFASPYLDSLGEVPGLTSPRQRLRCHEATWSFRPVCLGWVTGHSSGTSGFR